MTDCERLSERIPEVALGRSVWTADDAAHLATCRDCQAEWNLVRAARGLGERAPVVNSSAIAAAVQARLAAERSAGRRSRWLWTVAGSAAAAAAVALAVTAPDEPATSAAPVVVADVEPLVPLPELEGLETAQLDTLLQTFDRPSGGPTGGDGSTLGDETDAELEMILASWEG